MKFITRLCFLICLTNAPLAFGFDFEGCSVEEVIVAGSSNAHVRLDCTISPRPECATSYTYFGFDKSTKEGEQYLSVVLTAFASGAKVTGLVHDTDCPLVQGNVTLLQHIRLTR